MNNHLHKFGVLFQGRTVYRGVATLTSQFVYDSHNQNALYYQSYWWTLMTDWLTDDEHSFNCLFFYFVLRKHTVNAFERQSYTIICIDCREIEETMYTSVRQNCNTNNIFTRAEHTYAYIQMFTRLQTNERGRVFPLFDYNHGAITGFIRSNYRNKRSVECVHTGVQKEYNT